MFLFEDFIPVLTVDSRQMTGNKDREIQQRTYKTLCFLTATIMFQTPAKRHT